MAILGISSPGLVSVGISGLGSLVKDIDGGLKLQELMRMAQGRKAWRSMVAHVKDKAPRSGM